MNLNDLIQHKKCSIIDVRTPAEFRGGHAEDSINIPLQELPQRLEEIRMMTAPVVLCCASGGRSAQAAAWLQLKGFDCHNAGSWLEVNHIQSLAGKE